MIYHNIVEGRFIKRINRFIAEVMVEGHVERVHVKNTGRCKELFIEGRKIYLEKSDNPNRKTRFSLISIYKEDILVNIDSQVPNAVIFDAVMAGQIIGVKPTVLQREKTYGKSRFDLYYETEEARGFIEVKGATLEIDGISKFPDAPTTRGTKHVNELREGMAHGYQNYIVLLIQMKGVSSFTPNRETDPDFSDALKAALDAGVIIKCYTSVVTKDSIEIGEEIPYEI